MNRSKLTMSRFVTHLGLSLMVLLVVLGVSPGIGSQPIGLIEAWQHWSDKDSSLYYIAFELRMPRAVTALVAGVTLSLCGALFQTLFRNVLATPYTLGVASGGSLGALIGIKLGLVAPFLGLSPVAWCALAGSGLVVGLVLLLAGTRFRVSGNALVLAGVTVGLFCGAMMMFVTYLADVRQTFAVVRWMMGSLDSVGYAAVGAVLGPLVVSWLVLLGCARSLNQFEMGDEIAASRGVRLVTLQMVSVGFASVATACVVSICGPIGVVGLLVPHTVRLIFGRDHRLLLPAAAIWGGVFLIVCDWLGHLIPVWYGYLSRQSVTASPLPIGVMTSIIGAPIFLFLLGRRHRRS